MRTSHAARSYVGRWLVAGALGGLSLSASAFVSPSPPPGFGGTPGSWTFSPPSPVDQVGKVMRGPGPSIAGAAETRAAYRIAGSGAGRVLAGRVVAGLIPGLGLALGVAWLAQHCYEKNGGDWYKMCGEGVSETPYEYSMENTFGTAWTNRFGWVRSMEAVCGNYGEYLSVNWPGGSAVHSGGLLCTMRNAQGSPVKEDNATKRCPPGWTDAGGKCTKANSQPKKVTQQEIETDMETKPLPPKLPNGVPYPLDPSSPTIWNPTITDPAIAQPLRIPLGNPQLIPGSDPAKYRQPVTEWTHSPTQAEPWRMDVVPKDVVGDSPTGQTGPESVGSGAPPSAPKEDTPDLCEKNPDILACQLLDTPPGDIPKDTQNLTFAPETPFGSGSCPADRTFTSAMAGRSYKAWDFAQTCGYITTYVRPLVLLLATFAAFLILMPGKVET